MLANGINNLYAQITCKSCGSCTSFGLILSFASITISTRECQRFRDNVVDIAATKISAGVDVGIGGHDGEREKKGDEQFEISDSRNVDEVYKALTDKGLQPVMSDYIYV